MDSSIYRMRPRDVLVVCVLALLSLGVVMVQSASTTLNGIITHAGASPRRRLMALRQRLAASPLSRAAEASI